MTPSLLRPDDARHLLRRLTCTATPAAGTRPVRRRLRCTPRACLGLLLGLVTCTGCGSGTVVESAGGPLLRPVATVDQVMDSIIIPSSDAIFDAVVYTNGELAQAPATDEDWYAIQMHALAVAEAGNLLMMAPRARDKGEWMTMSRAFTDRAIDVAGAAEAKDIDRLLMTGSTLYETCVNCHEKYIPED